MAGDVDKAEVGWKNVRDLSLSLADGRRELSVTLYHVQYVPRPHHLVLGLSLISLRSLTGFRKKHPYLVSSLRTKVQQLP